MFTNIKQIVNAMDEYERQYNIGKLTRMQYLKKMAYVAECSKYINNQAKLEKRIKLENRIKNNEK